MTKLSSWFAVGLLTAACAAPALAVNGIEDMNGYWTGNGSVILSNGNTERVKCSVTYKVTDGGTQIRQSMRCASADYKIDALAELRVKGERVSGSWEEKTYSATGAVTGTLLRQQLRAVDPGRQFLGGHERVALGLQAEHQHFPAGTGRYAHLDRPRQVLIARRRRSLSRCGTIATLRAKTRGRSVA